MTFHTHSTVLTCALAAFAMGCSVPSTDDHSVRPGDKDTTSSTTAGTMRVSF